MNSRQKAIYLLLLFGGVLFLAAVWNVPETQAPQIVH
jgi:hypothetical protein